VEDQKVGGGEVGEEGALWEVEGCGGREVGEEGALWEVEGCGGREVGEECKGGQEGNGNGYKMCRG